MGQITTPPKALLFVGILHSTDIELSDFAFMLQKFFGPPLLRSETFSFHETDYYLEEMGKDLSRLWLGFDCFIEPDKLVDIKHECNHMEKTLYTVNGKRKVNLDPGYLTLGKVVLASTKNNQHRIYLGRGIYGEVTLRYRKKQYQPWEWTFADYRRKEAVQFFIQLRNHLKLHLRKA
jgi:hypothetical protein